MNLSEKQKLAIISAAPSSDYCYLGHHSTMQSLIKRNLADYTGGFGFKWGALIELTDAGKIMREQLISERKIKNNSTPTRRK